MGPKQDAMMHIFYCPGHSIQIQNHKEVCPNYVFSLPKGIDFVPNSFNNTGKACFNVKNFSVVDYPRINSFIFSDTHEELSIIPGWEHLRKEIKEETIDFIDLTDSLFTPFTLYVTLFVIIFRLLLLFPCAYCFYVKNLFKCSHKISPEVHRLEVQPLRSIIVSIKES